MSLQKFSTLEDMSRIFHLFFVMAKTSNTTKRVIFEQNHQHMATDCKGLGIKVAGKTVFLAQLLQKENHVNFAAPTKRLIYRE